MSAALLHRDDDFQLAFRESLGFFHHIPTHEWLRMNDITKGRVYHSMEYNKLTNQHELGPSQRYYAANWDPNFSCRLENSIGQAAQVDGHEWVCDPYCLANNKDCLVVYSFGSNGEFDFEADLQRLLPNCEIHVFDPIVYLQRMPKSGLYQTKYHAWGLISS